MSPIGRIFVVLNLILAAAFLGWAATSLASAESWRDKFDEKASEMEETVAQRQTEIDELQVRVNTLTEEQTRFRNQRDQFEAEVEQLQTQLGDERRRADQLQADVTKIQATLADYNETIQTLSAEKDRALERAQQAESARDEAQDAAQEAEMARRDAEDALRQANQRLADLEAELEEVRGRVGSLQNRLRSLASMTGISVEEVPDQPEIDAAVIQVHDLQPPLVVLDAGKKQGVQPGFTFQIYLGNEYKGEATVEEVQEDQSSALVTMSVPGQVIQKGDRASTQL